MIVVMMRIVMMMMNVVMVMITTMLTYKAELDNDGDDGEVMMRMTTMVMMQRTKLRHTRRDEIIKALLRNPSQRPAQRGFSA